MYVCVLTELANMGIAKGSKVRVLPCLRRLPKLLRPRPQRPYAHGIYMHTENLAKKVGEWVWATRWKTAEKRRRRKQETQHLTKLIAAVSN